ncbi:hypothetical protein [Halorientalis sp. IM1011]|uniref:hypothetical protein n=1 Tax=Halorientalis sp. IM1011 TaxID=1932360 RepID=UPI0012FB0D0A|nr:hypothetical protein [Halorientalis sp. IM1011]
MSTLTTYWRIEDTYAHSWSATWGEFEVWRYRVEDHFKPALRDDIDQLKDTFAAEPSFQDHTYIFDIEEPPENITDILIEAIGSDLASKSIVSATTIPLHSEAHILEAGPESEFTDKSEFRSTLLDYGLIERD